MKKLMTAFIMLATNIVLLAQDTPSVQPPILPPFSEQEISREKIQMSDLPEAVREALKAPDYAGWTVDTVYKTLMTDPEKPESENVVVYIIELKRRTERAHIRFDKDGKRLDDKDNR